MPKNENAPYPGESIDSYAARTWPAPPPSARLRRLESYLEEVDRLTRCAVTAGLLLKQEGTPATIGALSKVVAEIQYGLEDLQRRRTVIMPNVRHRDDSIDAVNALGTDAQGPIYNIEALLDVMRHRIDQGPDGHLIQICNLCIAEMPKLRFALYGKDMGP